MKRYTLAIINDSDMYCSYGGVAPFIRNMAPEFSNAFDVEYYYIPEAWEKFKIPGRIKVLWYLIKKRKELKKYDFILSHIPEGSWLVGHLGVPYAHIYHGNSNPMTVSKWWFGKYFAFIFSHFYNYIDKNCPLVYSVGPATGRIKKLWNPINQTVKPLPYYKRKGLIFAGRLDSVKNIDRLIQIYSLLPADVRKELPFYIAGYGSLEDKLKNQVKQMALENQVIFLGKVDNSMMMEVDSTKQILLMASSTEGFPTAIAEAFSVGVPVISTAVGDIPQIVKNDVQGYLFPLDFKNQDYADAILRILSDYDRFADAAYKSSNLFDATEVTRGVIKDITEILQNGTETIL